MRYRVLSDLVIEANSNDEALARVIAHLVTRLEAPFYALTVIDGDGKEHPISLQDIVNAVPMPPTEGYIVAMRDTESRPEVCH